MNDVVTTYSFSYCFCPASLADVTAWNVYQVLQFITYKFLLPVLLGSNFRRQGEKIPHEILIAR